MEFVTLAFGMATIVLGLVLSAITLSSRIQRGLKGNVREVLVEEGIIRPGGPENSRWPEGWHSLPDTLEGILRIQNAVDGRIQTLVAQRVRDEGRISDIEEETPAKPAAKPDTSEKTLTGTVTGTVTESDLEE